LLTEKDRIYGTLYEKFKYNCNKEWDSKAEIESQIKKEKEYIDIVIKINRQQVIVEYLENTLKNITILKVMRKLVLLNWLTWIQIFKYTMI
jgi:hypothetical protein